jgi:5'(3')-deoxyribonucleotidase
VFVVSAAMDVPCSFAAKYRWLQHHFLFIPSSNIVFGGRIVYCQIAFRMSILMIPMRQSAVLPAATST